MQIAASLSSERGNDIYCMNGGNTMSNSAFKQLPQAWQDGIDEAINVVCADEHSDIARAFRENEAKSLLECELAPKPSKKDVRELETSFVDFHEGWEAFLETISADQRKLIAAWVRAKGEPTDYSDLEDKDYPAFIVKESDIEELER
jgi:soluble cytochrome b562